MDDFIHALRARRHLPSPRRLLGGLKKTALQRRILGWLIGLCGAGWLILEIPWFQSLELPIPEDLHDHFHFNFISYYQSPGEFVFDPVFWLARFSLSFLIVTVVAMIGWMILEMVRRIRVRVRVRRLVIRLKEQQEKTVPPSADPGPIEPRSPS